jgi:hypothetical protein
LTLSEAATSGSFAQEKSVAESAFSQGNRCLTSPQRFPSNRQRFSHPTALVKDVDWKSKVSVRPLADFAIRNKKMKL